MYDGVIIAFNDLPDDGGDDEGEGHGGSGVMRLKILWILADEPLSFGRID